MKAVSEMNEQELEDWIESHVMLALVGADALAKNRSLAKALVLRKLLDVDKQWPSRDGLAAENSARSLNRIREAVFGMKA